MCRGYVGPSTLSRIETGHRRIGLDQLSAIAHALGTGVDQFVEAVADEDVVIRPRQDAARGVTTWMHGMTVANGYGFGYGTLLRRSRTSPRNDQRPR